MTTPLTDAVVTAASEGDPAAFATIYRALSPAVAGYLTAKRVSDPEGVTSDVFLTVFRWLPNLTGGVAGLRTFAFSVAHARVVDELRRYHRQPLLVEFEVDLDRRAAPAAENEALDSLGTQAVLSALAGLRDDQRDVLALRVVADLTVEQVAAVMGRSVGAVKQLQRRALVSLRQRLAADRTPVANRFDC